MILKFEGFTEQGSRDGVNQDAIGMFSDGDQGLFMVSDGMGGHADGERASSCLQTACRQWWEKHSRESDPGFLGCVEELKTMLALTNRKILEETEPGSICGATVVLLFVHGTDYALLWSGDSRCYMGKKGFFKTAVKQLTRDDTWENQGALKSEMSLEELRRHRNYGKLVRAVGVSKEFLCSTYTGILEKNMLLAICSDGVYKYAGQDVLEKVIKDAIKSPSMKEGLKELRVTLYKNGAPDNMSCIFVRGSFA